MFGVPARRRCPRPAGTVLSHGSSASTINGKSFRINPEARMRRMLSIGAALGAATFAVIVSDPGVALADEPGRQVVTLHRDIPTFVRCPYGPLAASFDLTRDMTTFTQDGTPVRRSVHAYG